MKVRGQRTGWRRRGFGSGQERGGGVVSEGMEIEKLAVRTAIKKGAVFFLGLDGRRNNSLVAFFHFSFLLMV